MTGIHFGEIRMFYALWLMLLLTALYIYAHHRRLSALKRFADAGALELITFTVSKERRFWKASLVVLACAMLILALTRPGWNPKPKQLQRYGRDVVFVLDVSKSMLAEDLLPNRLERAKLSILDCIERIQGDRVSLVVFAGNSAVKCPLTLDYGFFRYAISSVSTNSIDRGGTLIGDALRKTMDEVFDDKEKTHKDIVLITDGEDHDSFPVKAAQEAGARGIRLIAIGLGDEETGRRIAITGEDGQKLFLKYKGQEIWSKLDADTLRKMVNATPGGKYFNVSTGTIDLGEVYLKTIASAEKKALESRTIQQYEEKFQIFLAIAFFLLCLDISISDRKRRRGVCLKEEKRA